MRGTVAKRLRKKVYGDMGTRGTKYYVEDKKMIRAEPRREAYQREKIKHVRGD